MNHSLLRAAACGSLLLAAFVACGVDDRGMVFEYNSHSAAGSNAAMAGNDAAGDSSSAPDASAGGAAGGADTGTAGDGGRASGGTDADAGAAPTAGTTGTSGGASGGRGGSSGSGGVAGSSAGVSSSAGSAGNAGATSLFPCGDLNRDLVDDCRQTLVQNSRFDAEVSGWDGEPSTSQVWDASNASGAPGSGSLKLSNLSPMVAVNGFEVAGSHQCITVSPTTSYDFAARVMLAPGQTNGQAGVNVWLFDDDACQGNLVTGNTPIAGGVAGSWSILSGRLWVPGGVHSMYVRLVAIKPFAQPALSVFIDDVLVAKR